RDHGGVAFLDLRDASGVVQVVVRPDETPAAAAIRNEDCVRVAGTVRARPAGNENPELPTGDVEVAAADVEVLAPSATPPFPRGGRCGAPRRSRPAPRRAPAVPAGGPHRRRRDPASPVPVSGPAPPGGPARPRDPRPHQRQPAPGAGRPRVPGGRDAVPDQVAPRGGARLPGHHPPGPRPVLRPAPVPPAVQAAADGGRDRTLLPDRALLSRRGPAGRPAARVHPARPGAVLPRRGGRLRPGRGADGGRLA